MFLLLPALKNVLKLEVAQDFFSSLVTLKLLQATILSFFQPLLEAHSLKLAYK